MDELKELVKELAPKKARQIPIENVKHATEAAILSINRDIFGSFLLGKYPVRLVSKTSYSEQYQVLVEHGSPACTDGKEVYVSCDILKDMLEGEFYRLDMDNLEIYNREDIWKAKVSSEPLGDHIVLGDMMDEIRNIILHELTHAFNEHSKLRVAASSNSEEYRKKLDIACELQANDGLMGYTYERSYMQTLRGVMNKRVHQETIGKHGLKAIFDAIELNEDEKRGGQPEWSKANDAMMKATGQDKVYKQQIEQERNGGEKKQEKNGKDWQVVGKEEEKDTDEKIKQEVKKIGLQYVKQLILESLSDNLKYDATTDSVIYDRIKKREVKHTYARPSKKIGMYGSNGYQVIRKGKKIEKHYEYNKTNKLTVLAVDASGSMLCQQRYVASILDNLLKQVKEVAEKNNIEVHYENLQACLHRKYADKLVNVASEEWQCIMRNYRAGGGNCFSNVLKRVESDALRKHNYDAVRVINLSDGLDSFEDNSILEGILGSYIRERKLKWVDAIIAENQYRLHQAANLKACDICDIREQVVIASN